MQAMLADWKPPVYKLEGAGGLYDLVYVDGTQKLYVSVNAAGQVFIEKEPIALEALDALLKERLKINKELPVYISGDAATPHGAMVAVLDYVRRCGVNKVAFNVKTPDHQ